MSIARHAGNLQTPRIVSPETMHDAIVAYGILPFFENPVRGFSVEELTPPAFWFDGEEDSLGPWDWKIFCVQSGDIAYGKFLNGKAAFATVPFFRDLMNWRRSLPKYAIPPGPQAEILDYVAKNGSVTIREIRHLLNIKKNVADSLVTKLQMATRLVTGDILRVYRGADLHYNGWQTASFCTPDALFGITLPSDNPIGPASPTDKIIGPASPFDGRPADGKPSAPRMRAPGGFPFADDDDTEPLPSPARSRERLLQHLRTVAPQATEAQLVKLIS